MTTTLPETKPEVKFLGGFEFGPASELSMAMGRLVTRAADLDDIDYLNDRDAMTVRDLKMAVGEVFEKTDTLFHELRAITNDSLTIGADAAAGVVMPLERHVSIFHRLSDLFTRKVA